MENLRRWFCFSALIRSFCPFSCAEEAGPGSYRLRFFHTHTGNRLDIVYRVGSQYVSQALDRRDYFLRDHRTERRLRISFALE